MKRTRQIINNNIPVVGFLCSIVICVCIYFIFFKIETDPTFFYALGVFAGSFTNLFAIEILRNKKIEAERLKNKAFYL